MVAVGWPWNIAHGVVVLSLVTAVATFPMLDKSGSLETELEERQSYLTSPLKRGQGLPPMAEVANPLAALFSDPDGNVPSAPISGSRAGGGAGRPDVPPLIASEPAPPVQPSKPALLLQAMIPFIFNVVFGPTRSARTRGHVFDMYGYMPYGDGYGAGVLNADGAKPWWYSYDDSGPQNSQTSIGPADFLPTRGPVCPPDCPAEEALDMMEAGKESSPAP